MQLAVEYAFGGVQTVYARKMKPDVKMLLYKSNDLRNAVETVPTSKVRCVWSFSK